MPAARRRSGDNRLGFNRPTVSALCVSSRFRCVKLQLSCGERIFDELHKLHLQRRMDRAGWWHVHSVRVEKYKTSLGSAACKDCGAGTYCTAIGTWRWDMGEV
jgi:hypothetical protein